MNNDTISIAGHLNQSRHKADLIFMPVLAVLFLASLGLATWYGTWLEALLIGLPAAAMPFVIMRLSPQGALATRIAVAASFMIFSALFIHQAHGLIEMHFAIFCFLAFLLYYRDWLPIVVAAVLIAVHHLVFFWLEAQQFPVWAYPEGTQFWTVSIHALFVVLETAMLVVMSIRMRQEAIESAAVSMLAQVMSNGDLAAQIEIEGAQAHSKLFNSVVEMQTKFRRLMRGISEHAVTVHDNCASLHHASQTVAEHSARQSDSAQRISSEVKHLTDSFNTVASFAVRGETLSKTSASEARESGQVMIRTVQDMRRMSEVIQVTSADIDKLGQQTDRIAGIANVIKEIAEQTNLLALNAAIEAARAGEQGRGFAVVADEVRKLAERTATSTNEIQNMIADMAQSKDSALLSMSSLVSQVGQSVGVAGDAGEAISRITHSSEQVAQAVQEIAQAINAQLAATDLIGQQVEDVAHSAQANDELVKQSLVLATEIRAVAEELRDSVSTFNVRKLPPNNW